MHELLEVDVLVRRRLMTQPDVHEPAGAEAALISHYLLGEMPARPQDHLGVGRRTL